MKNVFLICACALVLAACGNNNDNNGNDAGNGGTDMSTTEDTGGGGTEDTGGGTDDMGGTEDTGGGSDDMGGGNDDMGGGNDAGGADMGADMGPSRLESYGCTYATATDMTGNATVSITDIQAWQVTHNVCIIVDAGTVVEWTGNFTNHPLDGGADATEDAASPIDIAGDGETGQGTVSVTLSDAGDYGYFCGIHTGTMNGVIYVD